MEVLLLLDVVKRQLDEAMEKIVKLENEIKEIQERLWRLEVQMEHTRRKIDGN